MTNKLCVSDLRSKMLSMFICLALSLVAIPSMAENYICELKIAGAEPNNALLDKNKVHFSDAKNKLGGYTVIDKDLNPNGSDSWFIALGYKTTTDVSKAITDIMIMDGKNYLNGHREDENGVNSYITTTDGRRWYRAYATGTADLNKGAGSGHPNITVYYTRDKNTSDGGTPIISLDAYGSTQTAGLTYAKRGYESNGKIYISSDACTTNYGKKDYYYLGFARHTHTFNSSATFNWAADGKSCTATLKCACGSTLNNQTCNVTGSELVAATCTSMGTTHYAATITKNGKTFNDTKDVVDIPAKGHTYESYFTIDKESTCTEDGSKSKHCVHFASCGGKTEVTVIPAAHTFESDFTTDLEPTCTTDGSKSKHCIHFASCGGKSEVTAIPAKGHDFEEDGQCKNCDATVIYYSANNFVGPFNNNFFDKDGKNLTFTNVYDAAKKQGKLVFNGKLATIGWSAFDSRSDLTSVTIPCSVTNIEEYAFCRCSGLSSVTIPESVTSIGKCAFNGCSSLSSVTIPCSVTSIKINTFSYCSSLSSVTIPNSVTSIGNDAFWNCSSLTSITIPKSVTSIGETAFYGCSSLTQVIDERATPQPWKDKMFVNQNNINLIIPCAGIAAYKKEWSGFKSYTSTDHTFESDFTTDMEPTCTTEGSKSKHCIHFADCGGKTEVTSIPAKGHDFDSYGQCKECDATRITCFAYRKSEPHNDNFFDKDGNKLTYTTVYDVNGDNMFVFNGKLAAIGESAFEDCSDIYNVNTIPNTVTSIGKKAFYGCGELEAVTIPNSVTSIGESAFSECPIKKIFNMSKTPQPLADNVFDNPDNINLCIPCTSIDAYKNAWPGYKSYKSVRHTVDDEGICELCHEEVASVLKYTADEEVLPNYDDEFLSIDGISLNYYRTYDSNTRQGKYLFNGLLAYIGSESFSNKSKLTSVVMPNSVKYIEYKAFANCTGLKSVTFNKHLEDIQWDAFKNCSQLTSVSLPDSVMNLYSEAFAGCSSLKNVKLNSLPDISNGVFDQDVDISLSLTDRSYVYVYGDYNVLKIANADYSRDIKANWNTICLPFEAKSTEDTKFYTVSSLEDGVITLKYVETLPAGYPALVNTVSKSKLTIKSQNPEITDYPHNPDCDDYNFKKIKKGYEIKNLSNSVVKKETIDFTSLDEVYYETNICYEPGLVGTFKATTVYGASNTYNLFYGLSANTGKYVKITSDVKLKPFRAFIACEKNEANEAGLRSVIADNETVNAVETLDALNSADAQYFDINGRKQDGLRQGMNIIKVNGKTTKVIIK